MEDETHRPPRWSGSDGRQEADPAQPPGQPAHLRAWRTERGLASPDLQGSCCHYVNLTEEPLLFSWGCQLSVNNPISSVATSGGLVRYLILANQQGYNITSQ